MNGVVVVQKMAGGVIPVRTSMGKINAPNALGKR